MLACALRAPRARLQSTLAKPIFFDMLHSNNAARVRLWLQLKGMTDTIETRMVTYPDLQSAEVREKFRERVAPGRGSAITVALREDQRL